MFVYLRLPITVALVCFTLATVWGHYSGSGAWAALLIAVELSVLEVSLSFDNAVVNAGVLAHMQRKWRRLFLTVGIIIAVFGVRLLCPLVIVALATKMDFVSVAQMAIYHPDDYSRILTEHYPVIATFGGMFLLMVFLNFICQADRQVHWLGAPERWVGQLGKATAAPTILALTTLMAMRVYVPMPAYSQLVSAGLAGVLMHLVVSSIDTFVPAAGQMSQGNGKGAGLSAFLYLEVLDASFSLDGTIGAFAMTRDVVIIVLGLTVGALFVRSLTLYLVDRRALSLFVYLEHGAHYAIGLLALIMLIGPVYPVPEVVTGLAGAVIIAASIGSSLRRRRRS